MRATEFIRNLLDLIDNVDAQEKGNDYEDESCECGPDCNCPECQQLQYSNSPDELVADIAKVTTDAGGGVNGPKNPADIRVSTMALYPGYTYDPRNR